jgi:TonB family protein
MSKRLLPELTLAIFSVFAAVIPAAENPDYSKEAAVIQNMTTRISFSADGAREWRQTLSVRVQSEAAVRQFGVLSFFYNAESEQVKVEYVRVKKADGSTVETPESSALDIATEAATAAPTYSDLRQKQIPVKALGTGDVLEYSVRNVRPKPEVANQFWYDQTLIDDAVVLNQSLEVRVPKEKYTQVSSPKLRAETRDEGGQRVYLWKHAHLEPSKPENKKNQAGDDEPLRVRITTFKNWEEVGAWWGTLAAGQAVVTPAIQDKAKQLTSGLSTEADKAKAIYTYVAMKFRYISISFGAGRYKPHSAEEVLANQYGDCKDKHTLLTAMMKAAGIRVWPALIGAGMKFDASMPSPAQFNHVITVLPRDGKYVWLDTTAEVAPFGLLGQVIRDEEALIIPPDGMPSIVKTPADPPYAVSNKVDVKSTLAPDGTLTGHFEFQTNGDYAVGARTGFHQLAPTQWQELVQQMSYAMGYGGEVSGVNVENLEEIDKPIQYSYDYKRANFSAWQEHKITLPLPPIGFGPGDEAEKPKEAFWAGAPGEAVYRAAVQLPKGFSIEPPRDVALTSGFAEYSAHYSFKDGTLFAERKMAIKRSKVAIEQWAEYQKFQKGVRTDQNDFILVSEVGSDQTKAITESNPEAQQLMQRAAVAMQSHNVNEARDLLRQVERLNPQQPGLWFSRGFIDMASNNNEQAIADLRKEIEFHPDGTPAFGPLTWLLIQAGRNDEAIHLWQSVVARKPEDENAASQLAGLLLEAKRYAEVPAVLEKPIAAAPDKYNLQVMRVDALLRSGQKDRGIAETEKIAKATSKATTLNGLAYSLADTDTAIATARELADKAITQREEGCAKASLANFDNSDLAEVNSLAAEWDTIGWVYFKQGDLVKAEKYVDASWQLSQQADVAEHLGEVYDKQGKQNAAIHIWRLALAANSKQAGAQERLRKAGAPLVEPFHPAKGAAKDIPVSAGEELGKLRTIGIRGLPKQTGSAEFFVLASHEGIEDAQFISGADELKDAGHAIKAAKYAFPFPDSGGEKLIRRGILSCSTYTDPSCQFVLLLPSTASMQAPVRPSTAARPTDILPPILVTKTEPQYSKAAIAANVEGVVLLGIVVDEAGIPHDVEVLKPLGFGLDEQARDCVLQWRFNPATRAGKPVKTAAKVEVTFRLLKDSQ